MGTLWLLAVVRMLVPPSQPTEWSSACTARPCGPMNEHVWECMHGRVKEGGRISNAKFGVGLDSWSTAGRFLPRDGASRVRVPRGLRYKEVVRMFADAELTHGTPAHTLALVFSGQAQSAVKLAGKTL